MKEKLLRRYRLLKRAITNYQYHKWVFSNGDDDLLLNLELDENSISLNLEVLMEHIQNKFWKNILLLLMFLNPAKNILII